MIRRALLLGILLVLGCGPPQVEPANYRLIESLRTALSARNVTWLDDNAKLIAKRRADGQMSEGEFAAFAAIIDQARSGDWTGAEQEVVRLAKAQRAGGAPPVATDKPQENGNPAGNGKPPKRP
jgi:hypothetical protein